MINNRRRHAPTLPHNRTRNRVFEVTITPCDGRVRRFKRSTKTTDRKLAQKLADEWEQLEKSAGEGRLTESQCRKVIAQMYERTVGEPLHFKTVREYLTEWVESKQNETEVRAWLKYDQIVTEFLAHVGAKSDRLLREITPADIRSFRDALKRKGLAAPTVNHAIKILRMPFKAAHDAGYIDINPNTTARAAEAAATAPEPLQVSNTAHLRDLAASEPVSLAGTLKRSPVSSSISWSLPGSSCRRSGRCRSRRQLRKSDECGAVASCDPDARAQGDKNH